jgi:hypothetical protein
MRMFDNLWSRRDVLLFAGTTVLTALPGVARARKVSAAEEEKRSAYERAIRASAPVAYWRLGESQGPIAHDAMGRGNDGRYSGQPIFSQTGAIASDPNRAVGLNGPRTKSHIEVRDHQDFSIATSGKGLSVEVWMRPDALDFDGEEGHSSDDYIHWLGKGEKGRYEWGFRFYNRRAQRSNRISAYVWNLDGRLGAGAYVEERLTAGAWVYLVATYDDPRKPNAQVRLYKDGAPSPHNKSPGTLYKSYHIAPQHGPAPLRLGTRDRRSFLTGGLDEVAIYPRVLTAEEIRLHWKIAQGKRG